MAKKSAIIEIFNIIKPEFYDHGSSFKKSTYLQQWILLMRDPLLHLIGTPS
jgi:hypothetical protein